MEKGAKVTLPLIKDTKRIGKEKFQAMISNANQKERAKAYASGSPVVPLPPQKIWVEPTNICTLKCIHCAQPQMTRKKGYMDFSLFKKIVDEASYYGMSMALTGQGEPLLHPEFGRMLEYASRRCTTGVVTNATRLNEERAKEILEAEPAMVEFSFDAPTKEIYERICRGGNYETTVQNITGFLDLKRKSGKKRPGAVIAIVEEPETENEIERFKRWCYTVLGRDVISGVIVQKLGNFQGESELWRSGRATDDSVKDYLPRPEWPVCLNPWQQIKINWDGTVNSCLWDYNSKFAIGNVAENTIMEVWNGEKMREFREALVTKEYERIEQNGALCSKCNILWWSERYISYPKTARANLETALMKALKKMRLMGLNHKMGVE